jgi:hypothetical protein
MRRIVAVTGSLVVLGVMGMGSTATAQQYPPNAPTCRVSDTTVHPGQKISVSGRKWLPRSTMNIYFGRKTAARKLGSTTVKPNTSFRRGVTIPAGATVGRHRILCSGRNTNGNKATQATTVTVS